MFNEPLKEVKPVGGKLATGNISASNKEELERFATFIEESKNLPPTNSNERAVEYRRVYLKYNPEIKAVYDLLKLEY